MIPFVCAAIFSAFSKPSSEDGRKILPENNSGYSSFAVAAQSPPVFLYGRVKQIAAESEIVLPAAVRVIRRSHDHLIIEILAHYHGVVFDREFPARA